MAAKNKKDNTAEAKPTFPVAGWIAVRREFLSQIRRVPGAWWQALLGLLFSAAGAWCTVSIPRILGHIVDEVTTFIADRGRREISAREIVDLLGPFALQLLIAAIAGAVLMAGGFFLLAKVSERVVASLRERIVGTALELPLAHVEAASTGDLVSRATDDGAEVSEAIKSTLPILTKSIFIVGATAVALATIDIRLLGFAVVSVPVYAVSARWYLRVAPGRYAIERAAAAERSRRMLEALSSTDTVNAFRMQRVMHDTVTEASENVVRTAMRARTTMLVMRIWVSLGEFFLIGGTVVGGFFLVQWEVVTVGAATGAALMTIRIRGPVLMLMRELDVLQSGYASLARIVGVVMDPPRPVPDAIPEPPARGHVRIEGVSFTYPGSPTPQPGEMNTDSTGAAVGVRGVNVDVAPGQKLAVVGASGAGKSTLASLIMGLRIPDEGVVSIDGVAVQELSDRQRGQRLAMVAQETHVFSGALRDDVRLADPDASDADIEAALRAVGLGNWFDELEDGLDTVVGERGMTPEPVVIQQLALARVLLKDPAIVVLDEATAEAGSTHAALLEGAVDAVTRGRTSILIAHRLDQAVHSDQVAVMEAGEVVESGVHADLISAGGVYQQLWESWQRGR